MWKGGEKGMEGIIKFVERVIELENKVISLEKEIAELKEQVSVRQSKHEYGHGKGFEKDDTSEKEMS
jgi:DNA-binding protein H-NS